MAGGQGVHRGGLETAPEIEDARKEWEKKKRVGRAFVEVGVVALGD